MSGHAMARSQTERFDRAALTQIVRDREVCDATGEPLTPGNAVAMTVPVDGGPSRLAVVSGTHWDSGTGALSARDPKVDPDVLDGRKLFAAGGTDAQSGRGPRSPGRRARQTGPVPQPRPQVPSPVGPTPRL
jgi:hypothetical protein